MAQPTTASGRAVAQPPLFVPTLMPMQSLSQQAVITSGMGVPVVASGMTSVIASSTGVVSGTTGGSGLETVTRTAASASLNLSNFSADLYLCATSRNDSETMKRGGEGDPGKPSIHSLEESYKELKSRNIKDTLSSFLLDMPGEFDSMDSQDTTLRHLLEQRLVARKDFHPLSGHALLGFRLLPGALPEQARIDPPLQGESRSQHRKRKHKHRGLEKTAAEEGNDYNTVSNKVKMPNDAYSFVKDSQPIPTPVVTLPYATGPDRTPVPTSLPNPKIPTGHSYPQTMVPGTVITHDPLNPFPGGKKKKKEKRNKEKKKDKKEKKKKKDKHHSQDPPSAPLPPPPGSSSSAMTAHPTNYTLP